MDKIITKQDVDKQKLSIFLRDLSSQSNVNLKHMIEDNTIHLNINDKKKQKHNKQNKKNHIKRKI